MASANRSELDRRSKASSSCLTTESICDWLCREFSLMNRLLATEYAAYIAVLCQSIVCSTLQTVR